MAQHNVKDEETSITASYTKFDVPPVTDEDKTLQDGQN